MKGFYTQAVAVLFERVPDLDVLASALGVPILGRTEGSANWELGGPTLIVGFRPEVNGLIAVDAVDRPWPDDMGSPSNAPMLFGAWSMGHFGPFTYPGNLERACQQAWNWQGDPAPVIARHRAFVRVRLSYALGLQDDATLMPPDCDPEAELGALLTTAQAVTRCQSAIAYFNPNGEVLMSPGELAETLGFAVSHQRAPIETWTNVRLLKLDGTTAGWLLMDTVGLAQLNLPDVEAVFHETASNPTEVARFLRTLSLYLAGQGDVFEDGHTTDGPGGARWRAMRSDEAVADPPRRTVRFFPASGPEPPTQLAVKMTREP
jgi:hypothetical protein